MSAVLFDAVASVGIVSWVGHLLAVWMLGISLGWLVSLLSLSYVAVLLFRGRVKLSLVVNFSNPPYFVDAFTLTAHLSLPLFYYSCRAQIGPSAGMSC